MSSSSVCIYFFRVETSTSLPLLYFILKTIGCNQQIKYQYGNQKLSSVSSTFCRTVSILINNTVINIFIVDLLYGFCIFLDQEHCVISPTICSTSGTQCY